ncbi:MAG TPA: DUF3466 family protein [Phycisphaerae bacterium]|nr:DUF3466 family protein [Phycisphaerae bacterium]HRR85480.1 DUF3466 family protein [Phycisphaerae bacterium]
MTNQPKHSAQRQVTLPPATGGGRFRLRLFISIVFATTCMPGATRTAQAECYAVTNVGTVAGATELQVRDMNNAGEIVGWAVANNVYQGFLYANGLMISLGSLGGQGCQAHGINDARQVVGAAATATGQEHAFIYTGGQMIDLGTLGGTRSSAAAINNSGLVTGFSTAGNGTYRLFTWQNGVMTDAGLVGLTNCEVWDINSSGTVIGLNQLITSQLLAFNWTSSGGFQTLGTFGGAEGYPYRINDNGQIVGAIWTGQTTLLGARIYHAFLYRNGATTDLGTLGGSSSGANGINNSGAVVGWSQVSTGQHAFIYDISNGMRDLNSLISPTSGWVLEAATVINDAGQIAGVGRLNGARRIFLLTPSQTDADDNGLIDACEARSAPDTSDSCGAGLPITLATVFISLCFMKRRD